MLYGISLRRKCSKLNSATLNARGRLLSMLSNPPITKRESVAKKAAVKFFIPKLIISLLKTTTKLICLRKCKIHPARYFLFHGFKLIIQIEYKALLLWTRKKRLSLTNLRHSLYFPNTYTFHPMPEMIKEYPRRISYIRSLLFFHQMNWRSTMKQ